MAVAVAVVASSISDAFLFAFKFCAAVVSLLFLLCALHISMVLVLKIWWKLVNTSDRKRSCTSLSGLISFRLTALTMEFASSSFGAWEIILAPIKRILSRGRMYWSDMYSLNRKRFIHLSDGRERNLGIPIISVKKEMRSCNIGMAFSRMLAHRSRVRSLMFVSA